jgi:hypothetical protein
MDEKEEEEKEENIFKNFVRYIIGHAYQTVQKIFYNLIIEL